ncbi:LOW QUALITY PROTEIN: TOX high mobility group box family member 4b [Polyodon spathula]|uniref:LOW QUALITY PROTEIN: TOX high mobility group box family member 4b n=1 Tax=Polyodon spathula TaxID=7913 RepID=UPI001B7F632C|nr:LOW QUALITY PROTEIN: TOX high mobility group box family member 4b [Polyodon spathula]
MEFPGGNDHYLAISGAVDPFLSSAETFHTPSLGDEEFEIPPISLDPDPSLAVSDVGGHFDELQDPTLTAGGSAGADPVRYSTPFTSQGLEHLNIGGSGGELIGATLNMDLSHSLGSQYASSSSMTINVPLSDLNHHGLMGHRHLTTIDQSELTSQLGLSLGGGTTVPRPQSPQEPLSDTPSPSSSLLEEEAEEFKRLSEKRIVVESPVTVSPGLLGASVGVGGSVVVRKAKPPKKTTTKKKKDPNEPQKPVSAYALFFRDTQAAIKGQNPSATFGEVSKIVASMWDSLGEEQKQVYKRKTEAAKKEYLKALAAYRASQVSQTVMEVMVTEPPSTLPPLPLPQGPQNHPLTHSLPQRHTITNICTSNIILNHPQVITRSRTGATAPPFPPLSSQSLPSQHTHTVTKIIISKQMLASSGSHHQQIPTSVVTVIPASRGLQIQQAASPTSNPRPFLSQPPPLQQMQQLPPPRLQQMVHTSQQLPPPLLQAKPRGVGLTVTTAQPPRLQIKILPAPAPVSSSPLHIQAQPAAAVVPSPTTLPILVSPCPPPPTLIVGAVSASTASSSPAACLEVAQSVAGPLVSAAATSSPSPPPGARVQEEAEDFNAGEMEVELVSGSPPPPSRCVRAGCTNTPVESQGWDHEYCSNQCVADHCRDIFMAWCSIRGHNMAATVK